MPKTISFHNGSAWSRGHNIRDERYTNKQEHIDPTLTVNNVTLRDVPVRQAYDEIFGSAVAEYNEKQKRADRRIDSYYDKIKADKKKKPVYEVIVQIGGKSDTGNSAVAERQALERFAQEWEQRNPNLRLIGAYIHADEPDGTVHAHLDYIPVAKCSRGMSIQNSLDRALQQQGFQSENIHKTAQIAWQDREREALCAICRELNIDVQRNQGIGQGRKYLSPQEYRRAAQEQEDMIQRQLKPLQNELEGYQRLSTSVKGSALEKKKIPFTKRVSVSERELERVEEQARAYIVNRDEIDNVRENQEKNQAQERWLASLSKSLDNQSKRLDEREELLDEKKKEVNRMYERQRTLNEKLEEAENEVQEWQEAYSRLSSDFQNAQALADMKELELEEYKEKAEKELEEVKKKAQEELAKAQQEIEGAYTSLANVTKAIAMLRYDKSGTYKTQLSPEQERLISAIRRYSHYWIKRNGFDDLAENVKSRAEISKGIKDAIDALKPREQHYDYDRGGRSL